MGNVSKDQRADSSQRAPMGLQCNEKIPQPEEGFLTKDKWGGGVQLHVPIQYNTIQYALFEKHSVTLTCETRGKLQNTITYN